MKIFGRHNRFNWLTIAWLLCVNVLLLAHTAVPHGHSMEIACAQCRECVANVPHCDDSHSEQGHDHLPGCAMDQLYSRQHSDDKHNDCACCSVPVSGLIADCGSEIQAANDSFESTVFGEQHENLHIVTIRRIRGLRAPPVC